MSLEVALSSENSAPSEEESAASEAEEPPPEKDEGTNQNSSQFQQGEATYAEDKIAKTQSVETAAEETEKRSALLADLPATPIFLAKDLSDLRSSHDSAIYDEKSCSVIKNVSPPREKMCPDWQSDDRVHAFFCSLEIPGSEKPEGVVHIDDIHKDGEQHRLPKWLRKEKKKDKRIWREIHQILSQPPHDLSFEPLQR